MAELKAFIRQGKEGLCIFNVKNKDKLDFPVPSEISDPKIIINAGKEQTTIIQKNNLGLRINLPKAKGETEIKLIYQISK